METLSREGFEAWLSAYGEAWEARDPGAAIRLFTADALYFWTPFGPPKAGHEGIATAWEEATSRQRDVAFRYEIRCVSGRTGIAKWHARFTRIATGLPVEIDGVLEAELDGSGRCRVFREWWHSDEAASGEVVPALGLEAAVPQFTVPDVVATAEYYRDVLGFEIGGYWDGESAGTAPAGPALFAIVRRDRVEVFFNRADGREARTGRAEGAYDVYLRVAGLDALAAELRARGAEVLEGPEERGHGQRELVVRDCNGLILAFGEAG